MDLGASEKRRFARLDIKALVKWEKITPDGNSTLNDLDTMRNVSRGGIRLTVSRKLQKGDMLSVSIKLPAQKNISVKGRVVWIKEINPSTLAKNPEFDIGVEFIDIKEKDREVLNHFLFNSFMK